MGLTWSHNNNNDNNSLDTTPTTSTIEIEQQVDKIDDKNLENYEDKTNTNAERQIRIETELNKFKNNLNEKRLARNEILLALGKRMADLKLEIEKEKLAKLKLVEELEAIKLINNEINEKLRKSNEQCEKDKLEKQQLLIEMENQKENLIVEKLETMKCEEVEGLERQVKALKDVANISGEMLKIRELQVNELKSKLTAIEETGQAYEKEVENMRKLRALYEERARAITISHKMELDREKARLVACEAKLDLAEQKAHTYEEKIHELNGTVSVLDKSLDEAKAEISELRLDLAGKCEDLYNTTSQMAIINQLFSQVLSGPDGLERVTRVLEEHHDLINHLTEKGRINDLASTLLKLADQGHIPTEEEQDIAANLNKVWRILVELLGHHLKPVVNDQDTISSSIQSPESCYKSIDTPKGPKLVISVSQTFLRLKDLILEKNSLVKEVGRLKELNATLESRLEVQESRLAVVAAELHKTWDVVNRLKTQHKHLHTNEKVLRYELAQKRLLLNELKKELEDCRESWDMARAKNTQTEEDWRVLRKEFTSRKQISSAESGYEESPGDSQDEDEVVDVAEEEEEEWSAKEEADETDNGNSEEINKEEIAVGTSFSLNEEVKSTNIKEVLQPIATTSDEEKVENNANNNNNVSEQPNTVQRSAEEILKSREARLKRLEEQCKGLFTKMNQTSQRGDQISNRLVELHEQYGEENRLRKNRGDDNSVAENTIIEANQPSTTNIEEADDDPTLKNGKT